MVGVSYKTDSVTEQEHFSLSKENHSSATKILLLRGTLCSVSEVLHSLTRGTPAWHGGCAVRNQPSPFPGLLVPAAGPWGPGQEQTWGIQFPCPMPAPVAPSLHCTGRQHGRQGCFSSTFPPPVHFFHCEKEANHLM